MNDEIDPKTVAQNGSTPNADPATAAEQSKNQDEMPTDPAEVIIKLNEENSKMRDQLLRTLAEMENLRRRTQKEVKDAGSYAISTFARDIMEVGDNLSRAIEALPADVKEGANPSLKSLVEGVEMTGREMSRVFEKHGVKKLEPSGEKFDPNFHQAMFEVEDLSVPNGTVMQVVQVGYAIGDRVLRPALVGVSKGGPRLPNVEKLQEQASAREAAQAEIDAAKAEREAELKEAVDGLTGTQNPGQTPNTAQAGPSGNNESTEHNPARDVNPGAANGPVGAQIDKSA